MAQQTILNDVPCPEFQRKIADGHLEAPIATAEQKFEVKVITLKKRFMIITNLTDLLMGFLSYKKNSVVLDKGQCVLNFPFLSKQLKHRDSTYANNIELS